MTPEFYECKKALEILIDDEDAGSLAPVLRDLEALGFAFHKRDTAVWFEKAIDRQPDKDGLIEPRIVVGHADIDPPYKMDQWIPATIEAARRALDEWEKGLSAH